MRIGLLCHGSLGGSVRAAIDLGHALARHGHIVHLVTPAMPPWPVEDSVRHHPVVLEGAPVGELPAPGDAATCGRLATILEHLCRRERLQLLHFHYAVPFAAIAAEVQRRVAPYRPIALVGTLHGSDVTGATAPVERARLTKALRCADALTTVSSAYADLAEATFGPDLKLLVIPNLLGSGHARPATLVRNARGRTALVRTGRIIHVSNFREVKAPQSLGRIFLAIRRRIRAELLLVGDGPGLPALLALLHERCPASAIRAVGFQADVRPWLAAADLLLLASHAESFSLAALEAMAACLPVVAPRVGGLPELVAHRVTGLLFAPGDERAAANHALALLRSPRLRWRMGRAASARTAAFAADRIVGQYEMLYHRLLEGRAGC